MVKAYLQEHPEIEVIDWPTKGCDINPIEHLWAMMKRDWDIGEQRTCAAIEAKANDVWESIRRRPGVCLKLVDSVPNRVNEVFNAMGGWTKY